eukprot:TRINITY_DN4341_c0_g2_i2.p1 TRINITY_DN4341_c0_g2~~TRINITY_DN4341_c0_g2_i2.p1  ORF type:complete len:1153 (-),score=223.97 TRINITY_DN4341_c0_g2_i2:279-3737(-)
MMGFGSFGHGSSSTLSPLAQPFPKPNSPSPAHVYDDHYGYLSAKPSPDNLLNLHPTTSAPDTFSHQSPKFDPIHTDLASARGYGYLGAQSIASNKSHVPSLNPTTHAFSYGQHSEVATNNLIEAKPYYPQYASSVLDNSVLVLPESGYCVSTCDTTPLDGPFQPDISEFGYTSKWVNPWSRRFDGEQGQRKDIDGSLSWMDIKGKSFLSNYRSSLKQGGPAAEGIMSGKEAAGVWHGNCGESLRSQIYIGFGPKSTERLDSKWSVVEESARVPSLNILGTTSSAPSSIPLVIPFSQVQDLESITKSWNPSNPDTTYDRIFTPLNSYTTDPTILYPSMMHSSRAQVFGTPSIGTSSSLETIMSKNVKSRDQPVGACSINKDSTSHSDTCVKEPIIQQNSDGKQGYVETSKNSKDMKKNNHIPKDLPPIIKDLPSSHLEVTDDSLNHQFKANPELKVTNLNLPGAFSFASGASGSGDSLQSSSDTYDQFNPAVDSPCWKGAPSSRHSPFVVAEVVDPLPLVKESEGHNDLTRSHGILPIKVDDADTVSSPKLHGSMIHHESHCVEESLSSSLKIPISSVVSIACLEHKLINSDKTGSDCLKPANEHGSLHSDGFLQLTNDYVLHNKLKSSSEPKTSDMMPLSRDGDNVTSTTKAVSEAGITDSWTDFKGAAQDGSSLLVSQARDNVSNSSSSGVDVSTEIAELLGSSDVSNHHPRPRMVDAHLLVKMMHNLSEVMLSSHYGNGNVLEENDYEVLQLVMDNLNACIVRNGRERKQTVEAFSQLGSPYCLRKLSNPCKVTAAGTSQVKGTEADDARSQSDHQSTHEREGMMHSTRSHPKVNKLNNFISANDDIDFEKDNGMTKAIKTVMKENFDKKGDYHSQALLYKNLWIEAEAALCSMKYEGRLARMKIEMERCNKPHNGNVNSIGVATDPWGSSDAAGKLVNQEELSSSNAVGGINRDHTFLAPKAKGNTGSYGKSQETSWSSGDDEAEDIEASVIARFRVLKNRAENMTAEGKQPPESIDIGVNVQEAMNSPCCSENKCGIGVKQHQPMKVVNLGFAERTSPRPFVGVRLEGGRGRYMQCPTNEFGLDSYVPEQSGKIREFRVCTDNELMIQSDASNKLGKRWVAGGYDSHSDWEHVLKEELTWSSIPDPNF